MKWLGRGLAASACALGGVLLASGAGERPSGDATSGRADIAADLGGLDIEILPEAFAAGNGPESPFVSRARRGEVAPPDLTEVEQLCQLLTACDGLPIPPGLVKTDFVDCVKQMTTEMTAASAINFSLTLRECGLAANSCDQLRTCALRGARPDSCAGRGHQNPVGYCDVDGRALTCWHDHILAVRDCPRGDEQCIVRDGQSQCILGPCPGDIREGDPEQCSASGARILQCEHGKLKSTDCAAFGLRCTSTPGDSHPVGCATGAGTCASGSRRCDGNIAIGCHNGHEVRVDCAAAGLVCNATAGSHPVGACVAPPPPARGACNPEEEPTCGGNGNAYIKYCYNGTPRSFFCKPLFNSCTKDGRGVHCAR